MCPSLRDIIATRFFLCVWLYCLILATVLNTIPISTQYSYLYVGKCVAFVCIFLVWILARSRKHGYVYIYTHVHTYVNTHIHIGVYTYDVHICVYVCTHTCHEFIQIHLIEQHRVHSSSPPSRIGAFSNSDKPGFTCHQYIYSFA